MDDLDKYSPSLAEASENARVTLAKYEDALALPTLELASVDADIKRANERLLEYQGKVNSKDMTARIDARRSVLAYQEELHALSELREEKALAVQQAQNDRNKAEQQVSIVESAQLRLGASMLTPFSSLQGQATEAYAAFRQPYLNPIIIAGDRKHPEWECAVDELVLLCGMADIKRNDPRLPDPMDNIRAFWDHVRAEANPPVPSPSGQDVMAEIHAGMQDAALQKAGEQTVNAIEDHRPKANYVRSYLSAPRVPDDMRRT